MDREAKFNELFDKHYAKVFRLCKGYFNGNEELASDSTQEVFVKIWESLDSFRGESNISTWIYRISVNTCLLYLRKQSTKNEKATTIFPSIAAEQYSFEEEEKLHKMYGCIQKLEEKDKMITLMMLEGIVYQEISEVVGITEETLRVRIHRIKKNLTHCVQHGNI
ncbi:MAG: RNA polymerase sigma factor [Cyclobacteriaceae bacterium]